MRNSGKKHIDKSGADSVAVNGYNPETTARIKLRQIQYLNNIVEQDPRAVKRATRTMLGFKSFWSAAKTIAGIEIMHKIRKVQMIICGSSISPADQF